MELIQELLEIKRELMESSLHLSTIECYDLAVQIQRNRILQDSFIAGSLENTSYFSPEAKEILKEDYKPRKFKRLED